MSQDELSDLLGVSKQYLSNMLTGRTKGFKYINKIINILTIKNYKTNYDEKSINNKKNKNIKKGLQK